MLDKSSIYLISKLLTFVVPLHYINNYLFVDFELDET